MTWVVSGIILALIVLTAALVACAYRVIRGPEPADRLQAIDTLTNVLIAVIVVLALVQRTAIIIDVALALAAFSFIATLAIARYLSEGRVF